MNKPPVRPADDELLTREQLCERLQISKDTLYGLERVGKAPPKIKIGGTVRYPKSLLDDFLQGHYQAALDPAA